MEFQIMKVIYLNGASSSGKTSLSKKLQDILPDNYLHIGIDTLISMMPQKTNNF
jgi:chloramphenicol 3-O phosphotransferase